MCMEQLLVINRRSLTRVKEGVYHQYSMHLPQVPLVTAWGGEERGGGMDTAYMYVWLFID